MPNRSSFASKKRTPRGVFHGVAAIGLPGDAQKEIRLNAFARRALSDEHLRASVGQPPHDTVVPGLDNTEVRHLPAFARPFAGDQPARWQQLERGGVLAAEPDSMLARSHRPDNRERPAIIGEDRLGGHHRTGRNAQGSRLRGTGDEGDLPAGLECRESAKRTFEAEARIASDTIAGLETAERSNPRHHQTGGRHFSNRLSDTFGVGSDWLPLEDEQVAAPVEPQNLWIGEASRAAEAVDEPWARWAACDRAYFSAW